MRIKHALIVIMLFGLLSTCAHTEKNIDPTNINDLQNMTADSATESADAGVTQIRLKALGEIAMGLGAQGGLAWASQQINHRLDKDKWYFETIYNFNGMM